MNRWSVCLQEIASSALVQDLIIVVQQSHEKRNLLTAIVFSPLSTHLCSSELYSDRLDVRVIVVLYLTELCRGITIL